MSILPESRGLKFYAMLKAPKSSMEKMTIISRAVLSIVFIDKLNFTAALHVTPWGNDLDLAAQR